MSEGREPCPIHRPMPCSDDCPNSTESHVRREMNRRLAAAWDEGFATAGRWNASPMCLNPYRTTTPPPNLSTTEGDD